MRQRVGNTSRWFVKKSGDEKRLNIDGLRELMEQESSNQSSLLNRIYRYGGSLLGTRSFWNSKRRHLEAYARNLGCRILFFTFSAADMQWHDLQRHMPRFDEYLTGDLARKRRIVRENIQNQPHIAAAWFVRRFEIFREKVLKPLLGSMRHGGSKNLCNYSILMFWWMNTISVGFGTSRNQ